MDPRTATRLARFTLFCAVLGGCAEPADPLRTSDDEDEQGSDEGGETPAAEPASATYLRFDLGPAPMAIGDVPFPSELYRDHDDRIAIGALRNPRSADPMFEATRALLRARDGFCTTCNAVFAIEGDLERESLPASDASPSMLDAIVIADVDPESLEYGRLFGARWQWDELTGTLTVRPLRGETFAGARRYAIAVTDTARGGDGLPIGAAPGFARVRDGSDDEDPATRAATDTLAPALAELEALGLPRQRVRALAMFRTEDPTADLRAIREAIATGPAPAMTVDATWSGGELDTLLGVPGDRGPGIDAPPAAGTEGSAAIAHAAVEIAIAGRLQAKRFVSGSGIEIGVTLRDDEGRPMSDIDDAVPFLLLIPRDAELGELPVVVLQHGFNASRTTAFAIAEAACAAGFAVLAIDAFQHGDRAASATDERHAMRGDLEGADGFAETATLDVSARTFGLLGTAPDLTLFAGYPLAAFEQFAADALSAIHWVRAGDPTALRELDPRLAELSFRRSGIAFVGNSMGAVVGMAVLNVEPDIDAAVLNVLPGSIIETLAESGEFRTLTESVLLPQIGVNADFDELEHAMLFDPTVDLYRWVLEPVDPLALARTLVHERVAGPPPHLLVQLAGHDEVAAPTASQSVIAAAGIGGVGTFAFAEVEPIALPLPNVSTEAGAVTIAALQFDDAMHGMLEVRSQSSRYEDPLVPPLVPRQASKRLANPIIAVHTQLGLFLSSFRTTGTAVIGD